MSKKIVNFSRVRNVISPLRAHSTDAGLDFYVPEDFNGGKTLHIGMGESVVIPCGIHMDQDSLDMMVFFNKSGIAVKRGLMVGACVIDGEYQGELHIHLNKVTVGVVTISPGDKISQGLFWTPNRPEMVEVPIEDLFKKETERGDGKFGSTDKINKSKQ